MLLFLYWFLLFAQELSLTLVASCRLLPQLSKQELSQDQVVLLQCSHQLYLFTVFLVFVGIFPRTHWPIVLPLKVDLFLVRYVVLPERSFSLLGGHLLMSICMFFVSWLHRSISLAISSRLRFRSVELVYKIIVDTNLLYCQGL